MKFKKMLKDFSVELIILLILICSFFIPFIFILKANDSLLYAVCTFLECYSSPLLTVFSIFLSCFILSRNPEMNSSEKTIKIFVMSLLNFLLIFLTTLICEKLIKRFILLFVIEIFLSVAISLIVSLTISKCRLYDLKSHSFVAFVKKNKCFFITFLFFIIKLLISKKSVVSWCSIWYVFDYKIGFSSRLLPGSILHLFTGDNFISEQTVDYYINFVLLILCFIVSLLLNRFSKSASEKNKYTVYFLVAFFMAAPFNIEYLWSTANVGRMETFSLLFILIGLLLFEKLKNRNICHLPLIAFFIIGMLCYQGSIFLYFPMVFTVLICRLFENEKIKKSDLVLFFVSCGICAASFLLIQLFDNIKYDTLESVIETYKNKTDMTIAWDSLRYEYFDSISNAYFSCVQGSLTLLRGYFLLTCLVISPVLFFFYAFWKKLQETNKKNNSIFLSKYFWIVISNIAILPEYILNCDWFRWLSALLLCMFFEVTYLIYTNDSKSAVISEEMNCRIKNHMFIVFAFLVFVSQLCKFTDAAPPADIHRIFEISKKFYRILR